MLTLRKAFALALLAGLLCPATGIAADVVLNNPANPVIHSTALDQPELFAAITDNGTIISDDQGPVLIETFVDTGASGFVISHLNAVGDLDQRSLGFTPADYLGYFDEQGIGGTERGDVTRPFGVSVSNVVPGTSGTVDDLADYGDYKLWVRRAPGPGEVVNVLGLSLADPVNVVGMPVIAQRTLVMDPTPLASSERLDTKLFLPDSPLIPNTNITLDLYLRDFTNEPANPDDIPPGVVYPSHHSNPMIRNVKVAYGGAQPIAAGDWLFDTGAGSTMISFDRAKQAGLVSGANFDEFMAGYSGPTSIIGGIGEGSVTVPILEINEIRITAKEGFDVVWKNVEILVTDDVAGLDGIFGMNMLIPSVTIDVGNLGLTGGSAVDLEGLLGDDLFDLLFGSLFDTSPQFFDAIVFDATDPDNVELRLDSSYVPEPLSACMLALGSLTLLRHRSRRSCG